jgi:glycosyltransferase involved in cell wall biosynthesis
MPAAEFDLPHMENHETHEKGKTRESYMVALLGARMQYAVPRILFQAGRLRRLFTDLDGRSAAFRWLRLLPSQCVGQAVTRLINRYPEQIPQSLTTAFNGLGLRYAWRRRGRSSRSELTGIFLAANRDFCRRVCRCDWEDAQAVYTFNAAGLEILEEARRRGLKTVCEQTIAPYAFEQRILHEERELHPGWETEDDDPCAQDYCAHAYIDRERAEWTLADVILCGSEFVRAAVGEYGGPLERCRVVPYGVDFEVGMGKMQNLPPSSPAPLPKGAGSTSPPQANLQQSGEGRHESPTEPLRVLTVGTVSLRKGVPYVLEAARRLQGKAVFRMVGPSLLSPFGEQQLQQAVGITGPVPRSMVAEHYAWADVFLLPSVCEGSATATYEAIASGLPVICTPNAGSVIEDGRQGFVVPLRDEAAIVDRLLQLNDDRSFLARMGEQAFALAREYTVERYAIRLLKVLSSGAEYLRG